MIVIEDLLSTAKVLFDPRFCAPRNGQHPIQIVAHNGRFCRHRAHVLELFDLGFGLFFGLFGQIGLRDALFKLGHFVLAVFTVAEFLLNGLHLLIQVVLALGALHLAFDACLDLFLDLQNAHFALHMAIDLFQPVRDRQRFQNFLLLVHFDTQMTRDQIGQRSSIGCFANGAQRFVGDVFLDFGIALELVRDGAHQRLDCGAVARHFGQQFGFGFEEAVVFYVFFDPHTCLTFDQHLNGAVGQLQKLKHVCQNAGLINAVALRIVLGRINLACKQDLLVVSHHLFQRAYRFLAPYEERHDHMREHDDVAQRQNWIGCIQRLLHRLSLYLARRPRPEIGNSDRPRVRRINWGLVRSFSTAQSIL